MSGIRVRPPKIEEFQNIANKPAAVQIRKITAITVEHHQEESLGYIEKVGTFASSKSRKGVRN